MNNWNFNELTQQDLYDFKACQRQDKTIYGIPDKSECTKGKEIKKEDIAALAAKANRGDKKAYAKLQEIDKVNTQQKEKERTAKKEAEAKKKKEAEEAKGKKGKGGKGKKGGGKGKKGGGKGAKGKGGKAGGRGAAAKAKGGGAAKSQLQANAKKAQQQAQSRRNARARDIRSRISELQKSLRMIKNPEVRKALEQQISDALRSVSDLAKGISPSADAAKPGAPTPPGGTAPKAPSTGKDTSQKTNEKE
jgi:hypothetical protein